MGRRQLRPKDIAALEVMEGKVPYVYDDSVYPTRMYKKADALGGTLTAGVGHTGPDLAKWIGKTIPEQQIAAWLDADNDVAENFVSTKITVPLNDNEFAAMVFWVFNIGAGAAAGSTLVKKLNAGDRDSVPAQLRRWTKTRVNGKMITSNGLIKRRADEIAYWLADSSDAPKPVARPKNKPSGTQVAEVETPKTVTIESVATGAGILATLMQSVTSGPLAWALALVLVAAFGIAAYFFINKRLFPR